MCCVTAINELQILHLNNSPNAIKDTARVVNDTKTSSSLKNALTYGNNDTVTRAVSRSV